MDLDLEADLGIDTVKQAEVFATVREAYGIEFDESLKLRDYPTMNHVVDFVRARTGSAAAQPAAEPAAAARAGGAGSAPAAVAEAEPAAVAGPAADEVAARVVDLVARETGYPTELLDMDLDLEADLGIDTVKQAEVFATVREAYGIEFDESLKLRDYPTMNHVVDFVRARTGSAGRRGRAAEPAEAAAPRPRRRPRSRPHPRPPRRSRRASPSARAIRGACPSPSCVRRSTSASIPA